MDDEHIAAEATITTQFSYPRIDVQNAELNTQLVIKPFQTAPATVSVGMTKTVQVAPYEPLVINVAVSLPCYKEEVSNTLKVAAEVAKTALITELTKLPSWKGKLDQLVTQAKNSF